MAKKNYPLNQTKEQAAATAGNIEEAQAARDGEKSLALSLVSTEVAAVDMTQFERKNLPPMVKPDDFPIGSQLSAEIIDVVKSPVSTIKGNLLWLKHTASGREITFPATGTIRSALAPGMRDDDAGLLAKLGEYKGRTVLLIRRENKPSKFKKEMFMFEVFVSKETAGAGKKK